MKIRRPTLGDRMDNAAETQYRRRQSSGELAIEQAQAKQWDQLVRVSDRRADDLHPYRGSRMEAEHRNRGS